MLLIVSLFERGKKDMIMNWCGGISMQIRMRWISSGNVVVVTRWSEGKRCANITDVDLK